MIIGWIYLESVAAKAISLEERVGLCHLRLLEIEETYPTWLAKSLNVALQCQWYWLPRFKPCLSPFLMNTSRPTTTTTTTTLQPHPPPSFPLPSSSLSLSRLPEVFHKDMYASVKCLEDRLLHIEHEAPLYFALNFMYPHRSDQLPPVPKVQVTKLGPRWIHHTVYESPVVLKRRG
ncbi:hypothetical protein HMI55_005549 [Coelomomyces lativittatus]|nr:hypothetical protein HMI55_005549 [Coelomomyces lativittatus]